MILISGIVVPKTWAIGESSKFRIPQILYQGGNSKPRPEAIISLLAQLAKRTSVNVKRQEINLKISDPALFRYPLIYLAGDAGFKPFPKKEIKTLRTNPERTRQIRTCSQVG